MTVLQMAKVAHYKETVAADSRVDKRRARVGLARLDASFRRACRATRRTVATGGEGATARGAPNLR